MTFNVEEKHAVAGAAVAAGVPTLANNLGVDSLINDMADAVFEGDRGSARYTSGIGFSAIGAAMILAAILGDFSGFAGIAMVGAGVGSIGLAIETFMD
jgi:hypothetical protein